MAMNFTVILFSRQHFGADRDAFARGEFSQVPFVGLTKDYSFDCPNVNASETGFLLFQSRGVQWPPNVLQINGVDVYGGLPVTPSGGWAGNIMLVEPHHQLKATGNVLHIEARSYEGDINDFILDNIV